MKPSFSAASAAFVVTMLCLSGCMAGGKSVAKAPPPAPVAAPAPVVAPPPAAKLNPFKVERPAEIRGVKKIFIPQFRVEFVASQSGTNGAALSKAAVLGGVNTRTFQILTDRIYEDLIAGLTKAGLAVVPRTDLAANANFQKLEKEVTPVRLDLAGRGSNVKGSALAFTPSGVPFLLMTGDPGASMTQAIKDSGLEKNLAVIQKDLNAAPVLVTLRIGFADGDLAARVWATQEAKVYGPKVQCFKAGARENCGNSQQARFWTPAQFESDEPLQSTREPASPQELRFLGSFSNLTTEKVIVDPPSYQNAVIDAVKKLHDQLIEKLTPTLK